MMLHIFAQIASGNFFYPRNDTRFSKHIFVVAPGLIVKSRLHVLVPASPRNYYDESDIVPPCLSDRLYQKTKRSHISHCVFDSRWEASEAFELDRNPNVEAWVKNDHLGFEILYIFRGVVRKYRPDFIIRLKTGEFLILETKGQETERDRTKREFLNEWVTAVNEHGGFGKWRGAVSRNPADVADIIEKMVFSGQQLPDVI